MTAGDKLSYARSCLSSSYDMITAASGALMLLDNPQYRELMEIAERLEAIAATLAGEGGEQEP